MWHLRLKKTTDLHVLSNKFFDVLVISQLAQLIIIIQGGQKNTETAATSNFNGIIYSMSLVIGFLLCGWKKSRQFLF